MDTQGIETISDFVWFGQHHLRAEVRSCRPQQSFLPNSLIQLEFYLRSIWRLIAYNKIQQPKWHWMAATLYDALLIEPIAFNPAWQKYTQSSIKIENSLGSVCRVLLNQIADLHYMVDTWENNETKQKQLLTYIGYNWKNPDLDSYLESAFAYFQDLKLKKSWDCSWIAMGLFLHEGKRYE